MQEMKLCKTCGTTKPKSEFTPDRRNLDGCQGKCKACFNAREIELSRARGVQERSRLAPDEILARGRAAALRYYAKHKDKKRRYSKAYRGANRDKCLALLRAWQIANPEKLLNYRRKRGALIRGARIGNQRVINRWEERWRRNKRVNCYWCGGAFRPPECHVDHINPIAKGGAHSIENLCVSCRHCNGSKKAKTPTDWNKEIREPILL